MTFLALLTTFTLDIAACTCDWKSESFRCCIVLESSLQESASRTLFANRFKLRLSFRISIPDLSNLLLLVWSPAILDDLNFSREAEEEKEDILLNGKWIHLLFFYWIFNLKNCYRNRSKYLYLSSPAIVLEFILYADLRIVTRKTKSAFLFFCWKVEKRVVAAISTSSNYNLN